MLVQLEAFARDEARDRHLELGLKRGRSADGGRARLLRRELLPRAPAADDRSVSALCRAAGAARGERHAGSAPRAQAAQFSADDLRDLQVWHKLVWIDPFYLRRRRRACGRSSPRGADFTEEDKLTLRAVELEILQRGRFRNTARRPRARPGRAVDLAVLPPDPAAAVRHRHLPAHPPALAHAAGALPPSRGRRRAADARRRPARAAVRPPARRALAVGRIGLGRDGAAGRQGRLPVDGDRRGDPGAHARAAASRRDAHGNVEQPDSALPPVPGRPGRQRRSRAASATTRCRT